MSWSSRAAISRRAMARERRPRPPCRRAPWCSSTVRPFTSANRPSLCVACRGGKWRHKYASNSPLPSAGPKKSQFRLVQPRQWRSLLRPALPLLACSRDLRGLQDRRLERPNAERGGHFGSEAASSGERELTLHTGALAPIGSHSQTRRRLDIETPSSTRTKVALTRKNIAHRA